jgi:hypothetical protein
MGRHESPDREEVQQVIQTAIPGWSITPTHSSTFVRTFSALPESEYPVEYETQERLNQRYIKATYRARVVNVRVRYQWEEKEGGYWWGQASGDIQIVNEHTGEPFKTGWRREVIHDHFSSWEMDTAPDYVRSIIEATHPRSTITVTETAA